MPTIYCDFSRPDDTGAGTTWATAKKTLAAAVTAAGAGFTIWVKNTHNESQGSAMNINFSSTAGSPNYVYCTADNTEPPTTITTGAVVATTGANALNMKGFALINGVKFVAGSGASTANLSIFAHDTASPGFIRFENCVLGIGGTGGAVLIGCQGLNARETGFEAVNTRLNFATSNSYVMPRQRVYWADTPELFETATVNNTSLALFQPSTGCFNDFDFYGVGFQQLGASPMFAVNAWNGGIITLTNCRRAANGVLTTSSSPPSQAGLRIREFQTDSAGNLYQQRVVSYQGTSGIDTAITATDGFTEGATPYSIRVTPHTSAPSFAFPFRSGPILAGYLTAGGSKTLTVELIISLSSVGSAMIWFEVGYPADVSTPRGAIATSRQASNLASMNVVYPASSQVWNGGTARANSASYSAGAVIRPASNPNTMFVCLTGSGTTAASEPADYATGGNVTDGGYTFRELYRRYASIPFTAAAAGPVTVTVCHATPPSGGGAGQLLWVGKVTLT